MFRAKLRGPTDHINIRISHSGFPAQYKGDTRNNGRWGPLIYEVFRAPEAAGWEAGIGFAVVAVLNGVSTVAGSRRAWGALKDVLSSASMGPPTLCVLGASS